MARGKYRRKAARQAAREQLSYAEQERAAREKAIADQRRRERAHAKRVAKLRQAAFIKAEGLEPPKAAKSFSTARLGRVVESGLAPQLSKSELRKLVRAENRRRREAVKTADLFEDAVQPPTSSSAASSIIFRRLDSPDTLEGEAERAELAARAKVAKAVSEGDRSWLEKPPTIEEMEKAAESVASAEELQKPAFQKVEKDLEAESSEAAAKRYAKDEDDFKRFLPPEE